MSESFFRFIQDHLEADTQALALKYAHQDLGFSLRHALVQIDALQKIKEKVPAWYRSDLTFPNQKAVEQCSSAPTAIYKASHAHALRVLDLTGGLGIDTWAFAQTAQSVTYVEPQPELFQAAKQNFKALGLTNIHCVEATAEQFLSQNQQTFDLVYIDPDRRTSSGRRVFTLADSKPDVLQLKHQLLRISECILIKASPMLDVHEACRQLLQVSMVHVIGWQQECKELLFWLEAAPQPHPEIYAVEISPKGDISTKIGGSVPNDLQFSLPGTYIIDPPASVMKAGSFGAFAHMYGLKKLHPDSHLFTADQITPNTPGRIFRLEAVCAVRPDAVHAQLGVQKKAHLRSVNFPESSEQLKKRLKLQDGGDTYLFATMLTGGDFKVLICRKV